MNTIRSGCAAGLVVFGLLGHFASAEASLITLDAVASGWYDNRGNTNGSAGSIEIFSDFPTVSHNWLGFNVSSLRRHKDSILSAWLEVYSQIGNESGQTIVWSDVTTNYFFLGRDLPGSKIFQIFQDLGSGTIFAEGVHTSGTLNTFTINDYGLNSVIESSHYWAIGGSTQGGQAFGYSRGVGSGDHIRLVFEIADHLPPAPVPPAPVPEPATTLLFGTGITGMIAASWRKKKLRIFQKIPFV